MVTSDGSCQNCSIHWTVFRLSNEMAKSAFFVGRSSEFSAAINPLIFDEIEINIQNKWKKIQGLYEYPNDGHYFIASSLACKGGIRSRNYLWIGGDTNSFLFCDNLKHNMIATVGGAYLMPLKTGQKLKINPKQSSVYSGGYSDETLQTSTVGFRYKTPVSAAWSLYSAATYKATTPPLIQFRNSYIQENIGWNGTTLFIQIEGHYVITMVGDQNWSYRIEVSLKL